MVIDSYSKDFIYVLVSLKKKKRWKEKKEGFYFNLCQLLSNLIWFSRNRWEYYRLHSICIYEMYISSVCIKVIRFSYKNVWFFGSSKGWCVFFYYFGTVLQSVVCLLLICIFCWIYFYCHFCNGVALAWIFLIRAWIVGIYFTIEIIYCEVWSGHLDQYLFCLG